MDVKAWLCRLKRMVLKLLELMVASSVPADGDDDNDWWRFYVGRFG